MARISPVERSQAQGKAGEQLDAVQKKFGQVPNMLSTLAHSPAALGSYLNFSAALDDASLPAGVREQIALTVAATSGCGYCASAHTAIGKMVGLSEDQAAAALRGEAADAKVQAALDFAKVVVDKRGWAEDSDLSAVRGAGYTDGEILEIVAVVVLNLFTNYQNHVIGTEIDFPKVEIPEAARA